MPSYEYVLTEFKEQVMDIQLNRPERLNAFNDAMLEELANALDDAHQNEAVRVITVSGSGRAFCAGQDLKDVWARGRDVNIGEHLSHYYHPVILALQAIPKPTIAKIQGVAAGAGMSLALACDMRIGSENARFSQAFVKIGLVPDSGSTYWLPRLVGRAKAMEMALLGDMISAEEAYRLGLLNHVVAADALEQFTRTLTHRLAQMPPLALGMIKQALHASEHHTLSEQLDLEQQLQHAAAATEDHHVGVQAFLQKTTPEFKGR